MTATNHMLSGAIIATLISNPYIALPTAFLSHFILDATPHYGISRLHRKTKKFIAWLAIDGLLTLTVMGYVFFNFDNYLFLIAGGLLAMSPDFLHIHRWTYDRYLIPWFQKFHKNIQWSETKRGIIVEIIFFALAGYLLMQLR